MKFKQFHKKQLRMWYGSICFHSSIFPTKVKQREKKNPWFTREFTVKFSDLLDYAGEREKERERVRGVEPKKREQVFLYNKIFSIKLFFIKANILRMWMRENIHCVLWICIYVCLSALCAGGQVYAFAEYFVYMK